MIANSVPLPNIATTRKYHVTGNLDGDSNVSDSKLQATKDFVTLVAGLIPTSFI